MKESIKKCWRCKEEKLVSEFYANSTTSSGLTSWCKACTKITQREYYERTRKKSNAAKRERYRNSPKLRRRNQERVMAWIKDHPLERIARRKVATALHNGSITKTPCTVCGATKNVCAHHKDYSKPLDIVWVCRDHHYRIHVAERRKQEKQGVPA